jgi:tetratricopeptide (TPR) repeat protein
MLHGKIQQAIGEYLKIIKSDPNDVLTLNTIGDLYLRQGNSHEANRYFLQVAERYVSSNFFLKAIAVYKKILNADPDNLDINATMASLYAKQGLSIDARNQYLRVAALLEKNNRSQESVAVYEKIVELNPANSAVQRKLAELYLTQGAAEKSHHYWTGAARAQAKAGDLAGAVDSFGRALQINPLDIEAMKGFSGCCLKQNNPVPVIDRLTKSMETAPENLDLREMLGKAHLANNDPEKAAKAFQIIVSMDEGRYEHLFEVANAWMRRKEYDRALGCLDNIVPILISRHKTERAISLYQQVLQGCPGYLPAMTRLVSIYSATGDHVRCLEELDKVADQYLEKEDSIEAVECLEKILRLNPESEKHRNLHRQVFSQAYPDLPYKFPIEPEAPQNVAVVPEPSLEEREFADTDKGGHSEIVEVDLLINYGLRDKAQSLLLNLVARDPYDKHVRQRLLSLYKGEEKYSEAAEQCLLLAALYRRLKNEETAQKYLNEAKQLSPGVVESEKDLVAFALRNGIEVAPAESSAVSQQAPEQEVDLSSDLLDIFFPGDQESIEEEKDVLQSDGVNEPIEDTYPQDVPSQPFSKNIQEQLQEVDFYIRLGFHDEAEAKLNEIAKTSPEDPELISRYQRLAEIKRPTQAAHLEGSDEPIFNIPIQPASPDDMGIILETKDTQDGTVESESKRFQQHSEKQAPLVNVRTRPSGGAQQPALRAVSREGSAKEEGFKANEMFADLMEEVAVLSDLEVSKESFEDHFNLGTAYRDMDLSEEAIREFELALKIAGLKTDTRRMIQCCGMLSTCCLKKGMPNSAVRWCQTGLNVGDISFHEAMALRYDMGVAHSMSGSNGLALECFEQVFRQDSGYRDVAQRIDELRACR